MASLTRYTMYREIASLLADPLRGDILAISDPAGFAGIIDVDAGRITETSYPEVDCQNLPYADASFDVVLSDQVLEHIVDPVQAISEARRVLKPGGVVIHTTCFVNQYHLAPIDYWRFSPDCLRHLHGDFSDIIGAGGWGNRLAVLLCLLGDRIRGMNIPERKYCLRRYIATRNESRYPIVTWIVARK